MKVALGDVCVARSSLVNPKAQGMGDLPHIGPDAIERDTGRLLDYRTAAADGVTSGKYQFEAGDVLYSKIRPNLNKVLRVSFDGLCSADMYALRVDESQADPAFLVRVLRSARFLRYATSLSNRANIPKLNRGQLMQFEFELPPLVRQRRIAAILDHADVLRAMHGQVLTHLDALTRSVFDEVFGSRSWPTEALGDRLEFLTSGSRGWAKYYVPQGDKFIRIQNVKGGYLSQLDMAYVAAPDTKEAKRTAVQAGDVLLSITADLGRTAVVPEGLGVAYINQHLAILRAPTLEARYLADFLESPVGQREVLGRDRGATKAGLNFDDVRSVLVPIPPSEVQESYAKRVEAINAQRSHVGAAQTTVGELFVSLQSRAFRGEL